MLVGCHDSLSRHLFEEMGPRKHGLHRSKKDAQRDSIKAKHTKSLKNKVRDVQRLLKKVRKIVNILCGRFTAKVARVPNLFSLLLKANLNVFFYLYNINYLNVFTNFSFPFFNFLTGLMPVIQSIESYTCYVGR